MASSYMLIDTPYDTNGGGGSDLMASNAYGDAMSSYGSAFSFSGAMVGDTPQVAEATQVQAMALAQQQQQRQSAKQTQQLQQQRFGLVVLVLRKDNEIGFLPRVDFVSRPPCGGLQAFCPISRHIHLMHFQRDGQPFALARAKGGPAARVGADAVINVHACKRETQRARQPAQHIEQHYRIETA